MKKIILQIVILLSFLTSFSQNNDSIENKSLVNLTLEDLMNLQVVTASKKKQDITFAPADITVVTEQTIKQRGYKDLKDVFRDFPGFDISENVEGEVRTIVINRGVLGNNKIMVLRDGKKLNVTTGERFIYGNNIPLFNVSRIEIIYGPASAMYGADAYSGVINLITKKAEEIDGVQVEMSTGSNQLLNESVLFGKKFENDIELMFSVRKFNSKGIDPTYFDDYTNYSGNNFSQPTDNYNIYSTLKHKNFTLGIYRMDASEPNGYGTTPDKNDGWYIFDDSYVWHQVIDKAFFEYLFQGVRFDLTSMIEYSGYEVKNESNFNYSWGKQYKYAKTSGFKWEEKLNFDITPKLNLALGLSLENVNSFPKTANLNEKFDTDILVYDMSAWYINGKVFGLDELEGAAAFGVRSFWKYGIYSELTYQLSSEMQVNFGARYDKSSNYTPSNINNLISPRLGFIWNREKFITKLLYGTAFIQPSEYDKWENFVAGNFLAHIPNPNLESENLSSFMSVFGYKVLSNFYIENSLFYYSLKDIIRPIAYTEKNDWVENYMATNAKIEINSNSGRQTTYGTDFKIQYRIKNLSAYLNYSYLNAREANGSPISKISPNKIRVGGNYTLAQKYTISPRVRWFDKTNYLVTEGSKVVVKEGGIDSRFVMDLTIRADNIFKGFSAFVNFLNVLNSEYYAPNVFGEGPSGWIMPKAPQPGFCFEFGLLYKIKL